MRHKISAEVCPILLAGGSGTRLWPLSRRDRPKQFVPLLIEPSPFTETLARLEGIAAAPFVICHERSVIASWSPRSCAALGLAMPVSSSSRALAVPHWRSRWPHSKRSAKATIPCYWWHPLTTRCATPTLSWQPSRGPRPLRAKAFWPRSGSRRPKRPRATAISASASAMSRVSIGSPGSSRSPTRECLFGRAATPRPGRLRRRATCSRWPGRRSRLAALRCGGVRPSARGLGPSGPLEHTDRAAVVALAGPWADLGSRQGVWQAAHARGDADADADGNVVRGDVLAREVERCYFHSGERLIAAIGLSDIAAVETGDAVLVTPACALARGEGSGRSP